ncbi:MAG: hypothetical protein K0Q55_2133, partial [Verrucomicrobia bacterium]|nr:hypothetical protein [Verrucomicrobiota bacterium]
IARTNRYFSRQVIIYNHALSLWDWHGNKAGMADYRSFARGQLELQKYLHAVGSQRESLLALLKHADPKVRTLALGALFLREDERDLPMMASLFDDPSPTFLNLTDSTSASAAFHGLAGQERSQSVSDVAGEMLMFWGEPRDYWTPPPRLGRLARLRVDFEEYWTQRTNGTYTIRRFQMKFDRATRRTESSQEYREDVARVVAELDALPPATRGWTALHIQSQGRFGMQTWNLDATILSGLKSLGPDTVIRFLQRQRVSDEPEMFFDKLQMDLADPLTEATPIFRRMVHFILLHAAELLRPEDVPFLLASEKTALPWLAPWWPAAAAEIAHRRSPAQSQKIVTEALLRYPLTTPSNAPRQAVLFSAVWQTKGISASRQLVGWFYDSQQKIADVNKHQNSSDQGAIEFLRLVQERKHPDKPKLLRALVADERFNQTGQSILESFVRMSGLIDPGLFWPLATEEEWAARTESRSSPATLAMWRERLRKHDFERPWKPAP